MLDAAVVTSGVPSGPGRAQRGELRHAAPVLVKDVRLLDGALHGRVVDDAAPVGRTMPALVPGPRIRETLVDPVAALAVAVQLSEVLLARRWGLGAEARGRIWLARAALHRSPTARPLTAAWVREGARVTPAPGRRRLCTRFVAAVGDLAWELDLDHDEVPRGPGRPGAGPAQGLAADVDELLGPGVARYFGQRYADTGLVVDGPDLVGPAMDVAGTGLNARLRPSGPPTRRIAPEGAGANWLPSLTALDAALLVRGWAPRLIGAGGGRLRRLEVNAPRALGLTSGASVTAGLALVSSSRSAGPGGSTGLDRGTVQLCGHLHGMTVRAEFDRTAGRRTSPAWDRT